MKIAFLGNFDVDYCTEVHHKKTFERMGHTVLPLQEGKAPVEEIQAAALASDMFMWTHTHGRVVPGITGLLQLLKSKGIPSVGYHLDLWMGIDREKDLIFDPYWDIEYFFSVDPEMVTFLNENPTLPKAFFLPAGVFEQECVPGTLRPGLMQDVIFVGSRNYHPEWPYRPILIDWLRETYGDRFTHWGGDGMGVMRGEELNDLYASAKVVVGDTLCPGFTKPGYLSDRIFETTGRGGFIIHPYIKGIEDLFRCTPGDNGQEIVTYEYGNFDQLKGLIDLYVDHNAVREDIRLAGHLRTKKDHTYTRRLTTLLDTLRAEGAIK